MSSPTPPEPPTEAAPEHAPVDVSSWHLADMAIAAANVRFWGNSGHQVTALQCPLLTQSGHERLRIAAVQTDG